MTPNLQSFVNTFQNRLELPVRKHLKNVYGTLMMTCGAATGGVMLDMYTFIQTGFLSIIASIVLMVLLVGTPPDNKNIKWRLGYLLGFALTSGMSMGPMISHVIHVDPSIIMTALLCTTLVFVCFSVSAMLAERGSYLALGGTLLTAMSTMTLMSLMNLFMGLSFVYTIQLYVGLVVMCGFILFDTQLIIEKRRRGDQDFVSHSLQLFLDFIGVFRRLVIILTNKEEDRRRRNRD